MILSYNEIDHESKPKKPLLYRLMLMIHSVFLFFIYNIMHLEEIIEELEKTRRFIPEDSTVLIHLQGDESEVFGVSVRILGDGEYQVIIE